MTHGRPIGSFRTSADYARMTDQSRDKMVGFEPHDISPNFGEKKKGARNQVEPHGQYSINHAYVIKPQ